ncbi:DUF2306 domain-containing protein [Sphaerisporangium sp. TRM90804]|uniref:DUF2306 domain-containing protein n=1 Tax=Sphaerisporangium sp. TRM90804 TaxID=3031113 RepID=UPI00244737AC|nr:DUF2306 domain-containing protein [Sphaerisporangium sp. TRM90804]MDH2424516.1 DUF2306 domain-containing protein [Sphaerisporangium sp. TRM90804]
MTVDTQNVGAPERPVETARPASGPRAPKPFWRRPWIIPLALVVLAFLVYEAMIYVPEETAPLPPHDHFPMYYPLLAVHMFVGTLAMITVVLQVWPKLRKRYPKVHRVSGRVYVVSAMIGGVIGLILVPFAPPIGQIGVAFATLSWIGFTVTGFVYARKGLYAQHRRFMLYSFAIVMNNVVGTVITNVLMRMPFEVSFTYLLEAARWVGWVGNLMVVQWWLYRTAGRKLEVPAGKSVNV